MANATKVTILGSDGNAAKVNAAGALEVDATLTPSGTQDVNLAQVAGATVATGNGTAAGAIRVALPTDGTGVVGIATAANATRDNGPFWTSVFGVSGARFTSSNQSASAASVTDAPTAGQKIVATDLLVSVDTAMRVDFREQTSGTVVASVYLPANGTMQFTPRTKLKLATADRTLQVQTSASGNIAVTALYYSEA
jgi:hypothetical protein